MRFRLTRVGYISAWYEMPTRSARSAHWDMMVMLSHLGREWLTIRTLFCDRSCKCSHDFISSTPVIVFAGIRHT